MFIFSVKDSSEDSGMEVSNGESTTSDDTPDSDGLGKVTTVNGENIENGSSTVGCERISPKLFKFSVVNSYGTAELDHKLQDDGKSLKLKGEFLLQWQYEI